MIMVIWRYPHFQRVPFGASISVLILWGQIKFEPYMYALIAFGWKTPSEVQPNSCEQGFPAVNDPKLGANVALSLCQWASTLRESTCFSCERSYSNHVTSMQSACIMLGAVAVTLLEQTKQIQQLPAQQRVQAICVLSGEKPETYWTHADAEHAWSELCCGPFHEAAAAPSCDTVRLTEDLLHFFPNNAGLVLTEAPWKKWYRWKWCNWSQTRFSQFFSFKATRQPPQWGLCQCADLTTVQIEWSLFADFLNIWIPRVVFFLLPFVTRYTHVMQPAAAPCMTAVNFKEIQKEAQHVNTCQHFACKQQPLWICRSLPPWRVDSMDRHISSHPRTLAATQSVETMFLFHYYS